MREKRRVIPTPARIGNSIPVLLPEMTVFNSCVLSARNRLGLRRPEAAIRIPFAENEPARTPGGSPMTKSISSWRVTSL